MTSVDNMESELESSLELFETAIDARENLEIIRYEERKDGSGDLLVIKNSNIHEDIEGHETTVEVTEIFAKAKDEKSAQAFVDVINNDRKGVVLHGITRIVGYYSRVNNWNKSKVGELRDRNQQNYALSGIAPEFDKARHSVVDNL